MTSRHHQKIITNARAHNHLRHLYHSHNGKLLLQDVLEKKVCASSSSLSVQLRSYISRAQMIFELSCEASQNYQQHDVKV